jgi:hypothetical protein
MGGIHRQRSNGGIKVPLFNTREESLKVIIVFAPFNLNAKRPCDLLQEVDAEAAPMPVVSMDGEWRGMHGSNHKSSRWFAGAGLANQQNDQPPCDPHGSRPLPPPLRP